MSRTRTKDESGAFAVMYALMTIMLLTVAALGTDLGNAVSRHTDTQNQADFAAYDAARLMTGSANASTVLTQDVVDAVRDALNDNQPATDNDACWRHNPVDCVVSSDLTDGNLANGEVRYTAKGLQVVAPRARVDFGFANVFGASGTSVSADATVNIFSAGPRVMPMFAVSGCDWGRQTLTDPANGQVDPVVPTLAHNGDTNQNNLIVGGVVLKDSTGTTVTNLTPNSTGNTLVVNGSKWKDLTKFGFFRSDDTNPSLVVNQATFWDATLNTTPLVTPYTKNSGGQLGLNIPNTVTQTETLWYIRAYNGTSWSPVAEAQPIRVGQTLLECTAGSVDGNFGTLQLPRNGAQSSDDIPRNIAYGLDDPLNLVVHQYAHDTVTDGLCDEQADPNHGAVEPQSSTGVNAPLNPNTNCVPTDTGLTANVATQGLITIDNGAGLLVGKATHSGCAPNGGSAMRPVNLNNHTYNLNDDTLSCFLLAGKTLTEVASEDYLLSDGPAFTKDLFSSPRFAYVPVLRVQPDSGTSNTYSIIDFRPAFITDEVVGGDASTENGLHIQQNDVKTLKVFFFNINSLPHDDDVPLIDFLGVGQRISHLVD
jgi:hypothetical protein